MPFGITNSATVFQRAIDRFVEEEQLSDLFLYLNNITIDWWNQKEHDINVERFLIAAGKMKLTFNRSKSIIYTLSIHLLEYNLENGQIKPNLERLKPLPKLSQPTTCSALQFILAIFAYNTKWILQFSDKKWLLYKTRSFLMSTEAFEAF